jgi:hypothetical protein
VHPKTMEPLGMALLACLEGNSEAGIIVRRDDRKEESIVDGQKSAFTAEIQAASRLAIRPGLSQQVR